MRLRIKNKKRCISFSCLLSLVCTFLHIKLHLLKVRMWVVKFSSICFSTLLSRLLPNRLFKMRLLYIAYGYVDYLYYVGGHRFQRDESGILHEDFLLICNNPGKVLHSHTDMFCITNKTGIHARWSHPSTT